MQDVSYASVPRYNRHILVVDDNREVLDDFKNLLSPAKKAGALADLEAELFGALTQQADPTFQLDFASQGEEALALAAEAVRADDPYAVAFVDVRMPPGIDGVETITELWKIDPAIEAVICTAYSDHTWKQIIGKLGQTDKLLILKKPFDAIEVRQTALSLTRKWNLTREAQLAR
jgi:CheY-like chemotaxis protein